MLIETGTRTIPGSKTTDAAREDGVVLLWCLGLCVAISIVIATLVMSTRSNAELERLHVRQRQTYEMTRSGAVQTLALLRQGIVPQGVSTLVFPCGTAQVSVQPGSQIRVRVVGQTVDAVDVIVFVFDPKSMHVTNWADNANFTAP